MTTTKTDRVLWRESSLYGEQADVEDPILAYVLHGQRHALRDPERDVSVLVAEAATGRLALLKDVTIERVEQDGAVKLRVFCPAARHRALRAAWQQGSQDAYEARLAEQGKPPPSPQELRDLCNGGGLAAQRAVLAQWRKED